MVHGHGYGKTERIKAWRLRVINAAVFIEALLRVFSWPLAWGFVYVILLVGEVFVGLSPWPELVAFVGFIGFVGVSAGRAIRLHGHPTRAMARRRQQLMGDDRFLDHHKEMGLRMTRTHRVLRKIEWPQWMRYVATIDPLRPRHALMIAVSMIGMALWMSVGGQMMGVLNPSLLRLNVFSPMVSAWIVPPDYTGMVPIIVASPGRHGGESAFMQVPRHSMFVAHVMGQDGHPPVLKINGSALRFTRDAHGDFGVTAPITTGDEVRIERGWQTLGVWRLVLKDDEKPTVGWTTKPEMVADDHLHLSYHAGDDYGLKNVTLRVRAHDKDQPLGGAVPIVTDISLPAQHEGVADRYMSILSLLTTLRPDAVLELQLVAEDSAGQQQESTIEPLSLPQVRFTTPLARAVFDARQKITENARDMALRGRIANFLAMVSAQPVVVLADPLLTMALRSGAIRLVLAQENADIVDIRNLMWAIATHIDSVVEQQSRQQSGAPSPRNRS